MSNKEGQAAQLDALIDEVVLPLEQDGVDVDINRVSDQVVRLIDEKNLSPALMKYCSIMHVKGAVRKRVAKRHDPIVRAEDYIGGQEDIFDGILQAYYPDTIDNYVPRQRLSQTGYERVRGRMKKAGHALLEHVDALDAWWATKEA